MHGRKGIAEIICAHHTHERTEDLKDALGCHLQLMIDSRSGALRREDETMAAAQEPHAGHDPDTLVPFEFAKFLGNLTEPLDLQFEPRALSDFPGRELASARSG